MASSSTRSLADKPVVSTSMTANPGSRPCGAAANGAGDDGTGTVAKGDASGGADLGLRNLSKNPTAHLPD
jgi:hypothetical protein